jgi:hypothetical protein
MQPSLKPCDVFMVGIAMALVAPKGRKPLSADALFGLVRSSCAAIPASRPSATDIALTEALMSAFAMFSLTSPSLLAFEKERAESNVHPLCVHKAHRNGSVMYAPQLLGAAIIHPDVRAVMPLRPEPIGKQDGTDQNDSERHAAKRFIVKLRQDPPHLKCLVTADSLRANAPHIATLQNTLYTLSAGSKKAIIPEWH